jgi:hypothetical protein
MRLEVDCGLTTNGNKQVSTRYCMTQNTWYGKSIELRALNIIIIIDLIYKKKGLDRTNEI